MKSSIRIFLVMSFALLILACPSSDEQSDRVSNDNFDFRKTRWGMTVEEVKSSEANTPSEEKNNIVVYKEDYLGMPSTMGYAFIDDKLVKAGYLIRESYEDPDDYINSYEKIKGALIDDFGPPSLDEVKWLDEETDQADPSGKAVCEGRVIYSSEWITRDSFVTLHLEGAQNKCRQGVIFESKENYMMEQEKVESIEPTN